MNNIKDELFYSILNTQTNIKASESEMINKVTCMENYIPKYTYSEYNIDQLYNEYLITSCQISNSIDEMYNEIINEYVDGYDGTGYYVQEGVDDWHPITPIGWLIKAIIKAFKFVVSLIKSIFTKKDATVSNAKASMDQICSSVLKPNNQVIRERVNIVNTTVKKGTQQSRGNTNKQTPQQNLSVKVQPVEKSLKFQDQKTGKIVEKKIKFYPYLCKVEVKDKQLCYSIKGIDDGKMQYQYKAMYGGREISTGEFQDKFKRVLADLVNTNGNSNIDKHTAALIAMVANVRRITSDFNKNKISVSDIEYYKKALTDSLTKNEGSGLVTNNVKFSASDTTFTAKQFESATKKLNTFIKLIEDLEKDVETFHNSVRAYFSKNPDAKQTIDRALRDYQFTMNNLLESFHGAGFQFTVAMNIISSRLNNFWLASAEYEGTCESIEDLATLVRKMIDSGVPGSFVGYNAWFVLSPKLRGDVQSDQDKFIPKWGQTRIAFYPSNDLNSVIKVATNALGVKATNEEVTTYNSKLKNLNNIIKFHDYVHDKECSQKVKTLFTAPKSVFENGCVVTFDRCKYTIDNAPDKSVGKWADTADDIMGNIHKAKILLNYYDIHKKNIGYNEAGEWKVFDYAL